MIVNVSGVGYLVYCPSSFLDTVAVGNNVELFTHLDLGMREETMSLYGFPTREELSFFQALIKISGVGPRSAMSALSIARLSELKKAIVAGDPTLLRMVSGIGKKTAERIVIELRDKLDILADGISAPASADESDVYDALSGLGYSAGDIRDALRKIPPEASSTEEKIKAVLKSIGAGE